MPHVPVMFFSRSHWESSYSKGAIFRLVSFVCVLCIKGCRWSATELCTSYSHVSSFLHCLGYRGHRGVYCYLPNRSTSSTSVTGENIVSAFFNFLFFSAFQKWMVDNITLKKLILVKTFVLIEVKHICKCLCSTINYLLKWNEKFHSCLNWWRHYVWVFFSSENAQLSKWKKTLTKQMTLFLYGRTNKWVTKSELIVTQH